MLWTRKQSRRQVEHHATRVYTRDGTDPINKARLTENWERYKRKDDGIGLGDALTIRYKMMTKECRDQLSGRYCADIHTHTRAHTEQTIELAKKTERNKSPEYEIGIYQEKDKAGKGERYKVSKWKRAENKSFAFCGLKLDIKTDPCHYFHTKERFSSRLF